ncbi:3'(2'),5'-bisphosphate nucleotidase CysQ [Cobetia marina]|uniref:3'(2'),5'-bisphosphate nucleotidase CysQ n=1 Tax=Cobetia marina TaxID=28258 RepID=UPI0010AEE11B|nr:3'(2'),5'-bisphosphate nucleotidase CysQ [Cobetia marina]TKD62883.1 3'(2'),5'-bisphosphate nucleotidase CysQ [Cobetia marina]GED42954.1 3'(2'),5'-bisphosphate nucleotidase CysQ [Cobetia marina]
MNQSDVTPDLELLTAIETLCREAGQAILAVAQGGDLETRAKADDSPVTAADLAAHRVLVEGLARLTPQIPVLSEESDKADIVARRDWQTFWLVDPLDGTREFVNGSGEYTVNVALIQGARSVLGVVDAPVLRATWSGLDGVGAFREDANGRTAIRVSPEPEVLRVVASKSHLDAQTAALIERLTPVETVSCGSSLKFCRIAEGDADLYPRYAPTCEWDTAAAQAVLEAAGGCVFDAQSLTDGQPDVLRYNARDTLRNPFFIACGQSDGRWRQVLEC